MPWYLWLAIGFAGGSFYGSVSTLLRARWRVTYRR